MLERIAVAGAAQSQPAGKALPSLLPADLLSAEAHIAAALQCDPFSVLLEASTSVRAKLAAARCVNSPATVVAQRVHSLRTMTDLSERLRPLRGKWVAQLPPKSHAAGINFPLIKMLISSLEYEDRKLVDELFYGMPIVGHVKASGVITERERSASSSVENWRKSIPARNLADVERVKRTRGSDEADACWVKTLKEINQGWLTVPTPISVEAMKTTPLTPRYALPEARANGAKYRLIDDFRASGVNDIVSCEDTDVPHTIDTCLSLAVLYEHICPGIQLYAFAVDFAHAYKHVPLLRIQGEFATAILLPPEGEPVMAQLRTQPFGPRRPPANWGRATAFARWSLEKVFGIFLATYVDDCLSIDPIETVHSAYDTITQWAALLGLELDADKGRKPTCEIDLLGARISFRPGRVDASPPPVPKREELARGLKQLRPSGVLGPAAAAKMRGRLAYFQTLVFGRAGRAQLQPFTERQYSARATAQTVLSPSLKEAIPWWIAMVESSQRRQVSTAKQMPVVL